MINDEYKISKEKEFHNERFSHDVDPRTHLNRWYHSVRHGAILQNEKVKASSVGKDVLEYGCADGGLSLIGLKLPEICSTLCGIDISDVAIEKAARKATELGYTNTSFLVMNAEEMTFPDQSFDLVFGRGILHHLDLEKSTNEIARVLRPDGKAIFTEPMGHNPLLNWYRQRTPNLRTEDEHPLLVKDFEVLKKHFDVEIVFYGLFSVLSGFFSSYPDGWFYRFMLAVDSIALRVPLLRRFAWHCLIVCSKR